MMHASDADREAPLHRPGLISVPSPRPRFGVGVHHGRPRLPGDLMALTWPGQAGLVDPVGLAAHDNLVRPA